MVWAEIHGKLGSDVWRSEDLLTSTAFGLLRYVPARHGILALLRLARPVTADAVLDADASWINTSAVDSFEITPWRGLEDAGVPDIFVDLFSSGKIVHRIIIEVKLHSGKSGTGTEDEAVGSACEDAEPQLRDQLARYWRELCQPYPIQDAIPDCSLIYLTAHHAPPENDQLGSFDCLPSMRLAWLSWRDVWQIASEAAKSMASDPGPCRLIAEDLAMLLHHKGLSAYGV